MPPGAPRRSNDGADFLRGDRRTLARIRRGIERVVRRFRPWSADQRGELVQEAIARVFFSLRERRFRGEASLGTYAQTVARNVCLEQTRRRGGPLALTIAEPDGIASRRLDPERRLMRDEEHRRNLQSFAALPRETQAMLLAIFVEGLSYAEVAERFAVSENTVKSRVFRSRAARRAAAAGDAGA